MSSMVNELLTYYDQNKRDLPWRKDHNPYHIWISEIMLQQTRVETVIDYYNHFIKDYPDIESLSKASLDDIYLHWKGLGYYSRAKNIYQASQIIMNQYNGVFPKKYEDLLSLPGIGEYSASAIASMAYNLPYVSIDGNFFRVFTRYYELDFDISLHSSKNKLKELLLLNLPERSGDFNQAVMDLGATICVPNDIPKCDECPLNKTCKAHLNNNELIYPYSSKNTKVKSLKYTIFIIKVKDQYIIHKREDKGLLASLYEFKNIESHLSMKKVKELFPNAIIKKHDIRKHHFSHQTWAMLPYVIKLNDYTLKDNEYLVSRNELLTHYSIPKCFNQFFNLI